MCAITLRRKAKVAGEFQEIEQAICWVCDHQAKGNEIFSLADVRSNVHGQHLSIDLAADGLCRNPLAIDEE